MIKINQIVGLMFFIPVEITSWVIGKKWMNDIINLDKKSIEDFVKIFGDFSFTIFFFIYMGNELYYKN